MANGTPQGTPLLTREKLLAAKDLQPSKIDVPEWGGAIKVKRLSKADKAWIDKHARDDDDMLDVDRESLLTIVRGMVAPQLGEDDVEWLADKGAYTLERIQQAIEGGRREYPDAELAMLTKAKLKTINDLVEETIEVEEWGGALKIRVLSRADQIWVRDSSKDGGEIDEERLDALVVVKGLVEPAMTVEDVEALMGKSADVIERVSQEILSLSAATRQAGTSAAAVESAEARFLEGGS